MGTPFARLDEAKQRIILDAAMAEFSEHGYEQASTNRIVAHAGISKGILFHYFGSKEGLYRYLVDYAVDFAQRFIAELDTNAADPIARWGHAARLKFAYLVERPHLFAFLARVYVYELDRLPPEARRRIEEAIVAAKAHMDGGIDATLVRDDIDPAYAAKIVRWSIEGYQQEVMEAFKDQPLSSVNIEPFWDEFHALLTVLRKILYRQEDDADGRRANAPRQEGIR